MCKFSKTKCGSETFCGRLNFYNYHWLPWTFTMLATRQAVLDAVLVTCLPPKNSLQPMAPAVRSLWSHCCLWSSIKTTESGGNSCWLVSVPFQTFKLNRSCCLAYFRWWACIVCAISLLVNKVSSIFMGLIWKCRDALHGNISES